MAWNRFKLVVLDTSSLVGLDASQTASCAPGESVKMLCIEKFRSRWPQLLLHFCKTFQSQGLRRRRRKRSTIQMETGPGGAGNGQ